MKFLIVLCAALACAAAKPQLIAPWAIPHGYAFTAASPLGHPLAYSAAAPVAYSAAPLAYSAAPVAYSAAPVAYSAAPVAYAAAAAKTQYHAQDELGQASYGHSEPTQTHHAVQDAFGNKVGSFSYAAPDGRILRTDYVADALGYRVSSNALPVAPAALPNPVQDTPEVAIARAQHLAAHGHHLAKRSVTLLQTPASTAPLAYASHHAIAAPIAYSAHHAAPLAYASHHAIAAPIAYSAHHAVAAPLAYAAAPAVAAPVLRDATLTTVVNTPGHAVSYRVD